MLKLVLKSFLAVVAVALSTTAAKADFVIDDFTSPNPPTLYSLAAAASTYTATDFVGAATRNISVTQTINTGTPGATNGYFGVHPVNGPSFNLATQNIGLNAPYATLAYSYSTPQNLSLSGTSIKFTFNPLNTAIPFSVRISDGTNTSFQVGTVMTGQPTTTFTLPMSGFTNVSLSAVNLIELHINYDLSVNGGSQFDADVTLKDFRVTTPLPQDPGNNPAVPAPAGLVLLLAAAPVLGLRRLRRKLAA
ncbi:MAG: hypothetical protein ACRC8S_14775 [Fimbriiglobus sp.]